MAGVMWLLAGALFAAALAASGKVRTARTMEDYTLWLALTVAGIFGSGDAALLARWAA